MLGTVREVSMAELGGLSGKRHLPRQTGDLSPTKRWKERADSSRLSSDLCQNSHIRTSCTHTIMIMITVLSTVGVAVLGQSN